MFGLSLYTTERDLREVFSKYGPIADVSIVYDQQSRRSRGFAFVYFENVEDAKEVGWGARCVPCLLGSELLGCMFCHREWPGETHGLKNTWNLIITEFGLTNAAE